jgi:hypothetical protein
MVPKRSPKHPHPAMSVRNLAHLTLLDCLSGPELVVYIRLVGATADQAKRTVRITNAALYRNPRTAAAALNKLEDRGLITIRYDGPIDRLIEVL